MQTELHRHLDVSLRISTLLTLAQERGLEAQSTSVAAFQKKIILRKPLKDLESVLARFSLLQKVFDTPQVFERVAFEGIEDCWNEGTRKVELRYSPSFVSEYHSTSWVDALQGFYSGMQRGLKRYPGMQAGLICTATRDFGPESVDQTVEFFLNNQDKFIGVDLAGVENRYPCRLFESSFKKARSQSARITIHAGEDSGPESIWEAIEILGAERIGHGIASIQDPQLVHYLAKNKICLEICPTSNWLTQSVGQISEHPLPKLLRLGVPVSINTDDPCIFGVSLPSEIQVCKTFLKMNHSEVATCFQYASRASFLN